MKNMEPKLVLTAEEAHLHNQACALARQHRESETGLCKVLRQIAGTQLHLKLGYARLFTYAVEELKLTKAVAYAAIAVARKTEVIPELKAVVDEGQLSVSKAARLVSTLSLENAKELIEFALTHTSEEIDEEVARRNPEKPKRDHARPVGNGKVALSGHVSIATHQMIKRAKSILASKGKPSDLDGVIKESLETWLDRNDPLRKAERAQSRRASSGEKFAESVSSDGFCVSRNKGAAPPKSSRAGDARQNSRAGDARQNLRAGDARQNSRAGDARQNLRASDARQTSRAKDARENLRFRHRRRPLKASTIHEVTLCTSDRCTFVNERGERCTEDRWLHRHHIIPLSQGGTDEPSNITMLCSGHHALVHQLSLPIDGQITWIRAPQVAYHA